MTPRLSAALAFTLRPDIEGGYTNAPGDHGGATNRGVTQAVYDAYRKSRGLVLKDVRLIQDVEVSDLYDANYWRPMSCPDMPAPLDVAVFDFGVNSGTHRAQMYLQMALSPNLVADGDIGLRTLAVLRSCDPAATTQRLINMRESFLRSIVAHDATQAKFLNGWLSRVDKLRLYLGVTK